MLTVCTIGCGSLSSTVHGPSYVKYASLYPDTHFAACCDLNEDAARAYAARFGFSRYYTDYRQMIEQERPDAVCIIVPDTVTADIACSVLAYGCAAFIEKPPGKTLAEAQRILDAAEASGAPTQVAFNRRFVPMVRAAKRALKEEADVPIRHIQYDFQRVARRDKDFSTTAIHGIDTVRHLAGADFESVRFEYVPFPEEGPGVCNIFLFGRFTTGATAALSFLPLTGAVVERATIVLGSSTLFVDIPIWDGLDAPGRLLVCRNGGRAALVDGAQTNDGPNMFEQSGFYAENRSFFEDVRMSRRPACDMRCALQSVEIAQAIRDRKSEYSLHHS